MSNAYMPYEFFALDSRCGGVGEYIVMQFHRSFATPPVDGPHTARGFTAARGTIQKRYCEGLIR